MPKVFSCRAECADDINKFAKTLFDKGIIALVEQRTLWLSTPNGPYFAGEMKAQFTLDMELEQLRDLMREQEDAHVMYQSLRELDWNTNKFERDHDL